MRYTSCKTARAAPKPEWIADVFSLPSSLARELLRLLRRSPGRHGVNWSCLSIPFTGIPGWLSERRDRYIFCVIFTKADELQSRRAPCLPNLWRRQEPDLCSGSSSWTFVRSTSCVVAFLQRTEEVLQDHSSYQALKFGTASSPFPSPTVAGIGEHCPIPFRLKLQARAFPRQETSSPDSP